METGTPLVKVAVIEVASLMTVTSLSTPKIIRIASKSLMGNRNPLILTTVELARLTDVTVGEAAFS